MKSEPPATVDTVKGLTAKLAELNQHARALLDEQLSLESANIVAEKPTGLASHGQRRERYLNGFGSPTAAVMSLPNRLFEIHHDRNALGDAIKEIERRLFGATVAQAEEFMRENAKRWTEIQRRRVRALLDLRRANADASVFRTELWGMSMGMLWPPADRTSGPFGPPDPGDSERSFLEACVKARIVSFSEIAE